MKSSEIFMLFLYRCIHFFLKYVALFDGFLAKHIDDLKIKQANHARAELKDWEDKVFVDDGRWCSKEKLIAHACGGNVRLPYTNSKEALLQSLRDGFHLIEVDVLFTLDDQLVCAHEFPGDGEKTDFEHFISTPIDGRFTPMGIGECLQLVENCGSTLIFDSKDKHIERVLEEVTRMEPRCGVVIQIFDEKQADFVHSFDMLYNLTYTENYKRVAAFCLNRGIRAVSISAARLRKDDSWKVLLKHNIKIYAHTVNEKAVFQELIGQGVMGVFTDFLLPGDM